jgi:hypothetical protein
MSRLSPRIRWRLQLVGGLVQIAVALATATSLLATVRAVDVVLLFATSFGAGVTTVFLVRGRRRTRGD